MKRILRPPVESRRVRRRRAALASFHVMKVEQVIGGVGGDTSQQAIQLRMRAVGQNLVGNHAARSAGTRRVRTR